MIAVQPEARGPRHYRKRPIHLTPRELEVIDCCGRLGSRKLIAAELGISLETLRNHLSNIYLKLDVHTMAQAVRVVYGHEPLHQLRRRLALERFVERIRAALDELDAA